MILRAMEDRLGQGDDSNRAEEREPEALDPYRFRPSPTLSGEEVAAKAGVDFEFAQRVNRALGFPDAEPSQVLFDERDAQVLANVKALLDLGIPLQDLISVARVYGQSLSAIADAETRLFNDHLVAPLVAEGMGVRELEERLEPVVERQLDMLGDALDYGHRRHLAMALQNVTVTRGGRENATDQAAVAFVDLVDFSRLADELHGTELGSLVDRFEDEVVEATTAPGVRIVKMIGDAAMITSNDPEQALAAALDIVDRVERDERLPQARAGVDFGDVVFLAGDLFGRTVNVAARLVAFARPGTTVVSRELLEAVGDDVETSKIGTHRLKGVGRVSLFKVRSLGRKDATEEPE